MELVTNINDIITYRNIVSSDIVNLMEELDRSNNEIVVLKYNSRSGKTYSSVEYLNNSNNLSLYVSDVHAQMKQLTGKFDSMWPIKGRVEMCPILKTKAPKNIRLYSNDKKFNNFSCHLCPKNYNCLYYDQFKFPHEHTIVTIANESLANTRLHTAYDTIFIDENMIKAQQVEHSLQNLIMTF